jgi:uncharacterized protein
VVSKQIQVEWTADSILAFLEDHRDDLQAMGVRKLGLFGSYVRDDAVLDSDVDFLLSLDDWTWKRWCRVWDFLEDNLGLKVDLVPEKDLRPELQAHVLPEVRYAAIR